MRAIQVREFGGPEVLRIAELDDAAPGPGELQVAVTAAGVNYADTHQAENSYLSAQQVPFVPGAEVVGTVTTGPRAGERVCGFVSRDGGYRERALIAEAMSFVVPDGVSDAAALSLPIQGLTAWHLLRTSSRMQPGESVVVHAAAGGVGSLAIQLARLWGAGNVIATASSDEKLAIASTLGAHSTAILTGDETADEVAAILRGANDGARVDIVLEMAGGTSFDGSLAALARFGRLVAYGMASRRPPQPVNPSQLMTGSTSIIGFWLVDCLSRFDTMLAPPFAELVELVAAGDLTPIDGPSYALADARQAHEDMRARRTTGKVVLVP